MIRVLLVILGILLAFPTMAQTVPWDRLPNVDASALSDSAKERAQAVMKRQNCYFECSKSVLDCVRASPPSKTALRLAGFITRQVVRGKSDADIAGMVMDRARSAHPFKTVEISTADAPCTSDATGKVVVAAFSDFDCPFCKLVSPILVRLAGSHSDKVTYCFKLFPVKGHGPQAVETSKAGYAAHKLGRFWQFHDAMYANFEDHDEADVNGYAEKAGMDRARFEALRDAAASRKAIAASKREGLKLGVKSTPAIFINHKRYYGEKTEIELKDRVEEELDLVQ